MGNKVSSEVSKGSEVNEVSYKVSQPPIAEIKIKPNSSNFNNQEDKYLNNVTNPQIRNDYPTLEEINQIVQQKFEDKNYECPICLDPFEGQVQKKVILCGHCFCVVCIDKALEKNPFCPLCRKEVKYEAKELPSENVGINNLNEVRDDPPDSYSYAMETQRKANNSIGNSHGWNIFTVRDIFSNDPFFNRDGQNHFSRSIFTDDPIYMQSKKRIEELAQFNHDAFKDNFFTNDISESFKLKSEKRENTNLLKDPFFSKGNSEIFNDPFFKKDHSEVFKSDPFFNIDHGNVFKSDPFFNRDASNVFKNDPFFS